MSTPEQCKANRERKKREREQLKRDLGMTVISEGPVTEVTETFLGSDAPDWAKTKAEREHPPLTIPRDPIGEAIEINIPKRGRSRTPYTVNILPMESDSPENTVKPNRKARKLRKIGKAAKKTVAKSKAAKKKGLTSRQVRASKTLVTNRPRPGTKPETLIRQAKRKAAAKEIRQAKAPRTDTRKATIYAMLTSRRGATQTEIMLATGWQAHTLRGFLSTRASKDGWKIISTKNEEGERHYKIAAEQQA